MTKVFVFATHNFSFASSVVVFLGQGCVFVCILVLYYFLHCVFLLPFMSQTLLCDNVFCFCSTPLLIYFARSCFVGQVCVFVCIVFVLLRCVLCVFYCFSCHALHISLRRRFCLLLATRHSRFTPCVPVFGDKFLFWCLPSFLCHYVHRVFCLVSCCP